jgi:phosphate transport system substrate-binding protein
MGGRRDVPHIPSYSKWFSEYNKLHPDVQINYQSIGRARHPAALEPDVFFGATDGR